MTALDPIPVAQEIQVRMTATDLYQSLADPQILTAYLYGISIGCSKTDFPNHFDR